LSILKNLNFLGEFYEKITIYISYLYYKSQINDK